MKMHIRSLIMFLCAASTNLIIGTPAQAGYIVTVQEVGTDLFATGTGAIDLTGLTFSSTSVTVAQAGTRRIITGATASADIYTGYVGPSSFASSNLPIADIGIGDIVGINTLVNQLIVPQGYSSNTALASSATWNNQSFSSWGATSGSSFVWTWGTGVNQNFTLQIGAAPVPETGSTLGLLVLSIAALLGVLRFRSRQLA